MTNHLKSEFAQQLEQHLPRLRRYARVLTRDHADADDLLQACVARAFAKQSLWQPGSDLRAWLFTIMPHLHVNDVRRAIRDRAYAEMEPALAVSAQSDPGARLELRDLGRAMARLPERQNRVLTLVGLNGLDYAAAAKLLGVPTGTVRSRLGRARESLRRDLGRQVAHIPQPPPRQAMWPAE